MRQQIFHKTHLRVPALTAIMLAAGLFILVGSSPVFGQAGDIGLYTDAAGTSCDFTDAGVIIEFYVIHKNTGGATGAQFMAPLPTAFTAAGGIFFGDTWEMPIYIGDSQNGVSLAYGACLTGDIHLGTITAFMPTPGATPTCTEYPILPDPAQLTFPGEVVIADCSPTNDTQIAQGMVAVINGDGSCPCGSPVAAIEVTNTNDSGAGSLRDAITQANASAGLDRIHFNIPGGGPHVITLLSSLPNINDAVIIDGYTEPNASPNTIAGFSGGSDAVILIELNGGGGSFNGLNFVGGTGGSTVRGLAVANFDGLGIYLQNHNTDIEGCFVGLDASGSAAGNTGGSGVYIQYATDVTIGGTDAAARNVIAANNNEIVVSLSSTGVVIQGNFIGTNPAGTAAFGGSGNAIGLNGGATATIGGSAPGAGNLISGEAIGINIHTGSSGVVIEGNRIGTDVTGFLDLGHTAVGVYLNGASGNTVGGTAPGAGNLISGNDGQGVGILGVSVNADNNVVVGNLIGTDASGGTGVLGNNVGVNIHGGFNNTIGGTAADAANVIAGNGRGVRVASGNGNAILLNSIHSNSELGIDLGAYGVTANDAGDGDSGANDLQNYPVITDILTDNVSYTIIIGSLNSTPNTDFRLEFFWNEVCDGSGNGEGETYLGYQSVTTDGSGVANFVTTMSEPATTGFYVTATATDPGGNTSEFSMCSEVAVDQDLRVVSFSTDDGAQPQEDIVGSVSLRIENAGSSDIATDIVVGLYHSMDMAITTDDLYVSRQTVTGGLAAGAEMDVTFTTAKLPFETPLGAGYMGVILDEFDTIAETNETNNTARSVIYIDPLAEAGRVVVYFDSLFMEPDAQCPGAFLDTLYVAAEDLGSLISGIEYKIHYPAIMTFISDFDLPAVSIGRSDVGISMAWAIPQDAQSGPVGLHRVLVQWTCDDCIQIDDPLRVEPHPSGYIQAVGWPSGDIILTSGGVSPICLDSDGDGVRDVDDLCPSVNAAPYDMDGDGCIDLTADNRRLEYWLRPDFPIEYVISQSGCPGIGDGSEFTEVQNGMSTWNAVAGSDAEYTFGGQVAQNDARALDQVNLVTFNDPDFAFPPGVLAVGIATSFIEPTFYNGSPFREGQLYDFDMIFNSSIGFSTASAGSGPRILGVAVHEAGHGLGISHSIVETSTMAYVLHPEAETLETEDSLTVFMHYGDPAEIAVASQLGGTIIDGYTGQPIVAGIVFAVDAADGDTSGCAITREDGSFIFVGLPDGDYYVACHPIDSTSTINYIRPRNINPLVASIPLVDFVPEWWNFPDSDSDDANDRDLIPVIANTQVLNIDIITNVDMTPPMVTTVSPADEETGVPIGSAILIKFSESIDLNSTSGSIALEDTTTHESVGLGGFASLDDSLLTILPGGNLSFDAVYKLTVTTGITDQFNNPLAAEFVSHFETEPQPDVFITSLEPPSGAVGAVVTIDGSGFEPDIAQNVVTFDGVVASVTSATAVQLVIEVPESATSGLVKVENLVQVTESNELPFTVLDPGGVSRASDAGDSDVGALPRAVTLLPDAMRAFVATTDGFSVVETDANLSTFLNSVEVTTESGLDDIDVTPLGNRVYAISSIERKLYRINTDETPIDIDVEIDIPHGEPLGLLIEPGGRRAFIPTDLGQITIWDLNQANTVTFETQVGFIDADPNLRGELATAGGQYLLALSGTGKLLVFDLASDALVADVSVGFNPRGVTANPQGDIAYVTDAGGTVDVVSLVSFTKLTTVTTGGSLRQPVVTPDGTFLFCVNRELNIFTVIDLRAESRTFLQVVNNAALGVNPTAAEIGSDGLYAFATSEEDETLNAVAIGAGPTLDTVVPLAAPVGSWLVLAGSGFAEDETVEVDFDGVLVAPDVLTDSTIVVTVPVGAASGAVKVVGTNAVGPQMFSNAVFFTVLDATPAGGIRLSGGAQPVGAPGLNPALAISPTGDFAVVGGDADTIYFLDTDPASGTFNQFFDEALVAPFTGVDDVVITPDGKRTIVLQGGGLDIVVVNSDRFSTNFKNVIGIVDLSTLGVTAVSRLAMHPDGRRLLVSDPGLTSVHVVDIEESSPQLYQITNSIGLAGAAGTNGNVNEMAFHPAGRYVYLAVQDEGVTEGILVVDMVTETVVGNAVVAGTVPFEAPLSMSFAPDGNVCIVLTSQIIGVTNRTLRAFDTSDPANPVALGTIGIVGGGSPTFEHVRVSPVGDRAVVNVRSSGFYYFDISDPINLSLIEIAGDVFHHLTRMDFAYTPDASNFYSVSAFRDSAFVQDFAQSQNLALESGDGQSGIANQTLAFPIRVEATDTGLGTPATGVAVTFTVTAGGGFFATTGTAQQTVLTGDDGTASIHWILGPDIGVGVHTVTATAMGLNGSPVTFTADAEADPETLPLVVLTVAPPDAEPNVAITTNIQATFRRAVDPVSIGPGSFTLFDGPMVVPVTYGFAGGDRKVSMTPVMPLGFGRTYTIEMTDIITDVLGAALQEASGPLTGPITTTFVAEPPPPLSLNSVDPPSGLEGVPIVISGVGINPDPTQNTVTFNPSVPAVITAAGNDFLNVNVPLGAVTGPVEVQVAGGGSPGIIDFIVLQPAEEAADEVIGNIGTGNQPTRSIGITPDGSRAYATGENVVVKIDIENLSSGDAIPVGIDPVAIVISPDGKFAYVANNGSATVSIIDIHPASDDFETRIDDLGVGTYPLDLAIHPDGDILFVANAGTNDLSIVDTDWNSETFHAVIGNIGTGNQGTVRSVSITPDGTRLFVGGDGDIQILNAVDYGVIGNIGTGNTATRSLSITPDGTKLVALTVLGQILVYDIVAESPTENQVIGTFGGGGTQQTRSLSITPDGAQVWAVQEISDEILVLSLDFTGGISVVDVPETAIELTIVAVIDAGEDPAFVVFDPTGSGTVLVSNPGDKTITVLGPDMGTLPAIVHVEPRAVTIWNPVPDGGDGLSIKSTAFRYIEATIELPLEPKAYYPPDIDIATVRLLGADENGESSGIWALEGETEIMDKDGNGVDELHVKFDRLDLQYGVPQGAEVPLVITGYVRGRMFAGRDTVETRAFRVVSPKAGSPLATGQTIDIMWESPPGVLADAVDVFWTPNDGDDWYLIAGRVPDTGSVSWTTPQGHFTACRVIVILYKNQREIGSGLSREIFTIGAPPAVALADVQITNEKRAARIHWTTAAENGIGGFHILRSQQEDSGYERITTSVVAARGEGTVYQFDDGNVHLNETYYYKLQGISKGRAGETFGPYTFVYAARFALEQNAPNPFNPTTIIRFTVPEDSPVKLVVYDVAGRHVRTLVNDRRRADHYDVTWDGKDANGRSVASGVYFYRIQAGRHTATKKMVMLK